VTTVAQQLERAEDFLRTIPGATEKATAACLNRAAAAGREAAVAAIGDRYAAQASDVRQVVTTRAASTDQLQASVMARSGPLALGYFPHTPTEPGTGGRGRPVLRAEILRGQSREVGGAFIARIGGKSRVMIRTGRFTTGRREGIKSVYSVPLASMLGAESVRDAVDAAAAAAFEKTLDREIDRALGGGK
jgi:hypothetical protein